MGSSGGGRERDLDGRRDDDAPMDGAADAGRAGFSPVASGAARASPSGSRAGPYRDHGRARRTRSSAPDRKEGGPESPDHRPARGLTGSPTPPAPPIMTGRSRNC